MKPKRNVYFCLLAKILVGSIATLLISHSAHGADNAWSTEPVDSTFTGTNWTSGQTPGTAATTISDSDSLFFGTSTITTLTDDEAAGWNLAGLTFNSGAAAFTINGVNSNNLTGNITNNSANLQTINVPLALTATRTVTAATSLWAGRLAGSLSALRKPVLAH